MTNSFKIVICDDEPINRFILQRYLEYDYTDIVQTTNGLEALNYVESNLVEKIIIFLDINMPIMNGFELLEKFASEKDKFKNVQCICLTGMAFKDFSKRIIPKMYSFYIEKPFKHEQLKEGIRNSLIQFNS